MAVYGLGKAAGVEAVAAERAGNRHGNVITNNIPESL